MLCTTITCARSHSIPITDGRGIFVVRVRSHQPASRAHRRYTESGMAGINRIMDEMKKTSDINEIPYCTCPRCGSPGARLTSRVFNVFNVTHVGRTTHSKKHHPCRPDYISLTCLGHRSWSHRAARWELGGWPMEPLVWFQAPGLCPFYYVVVGIVPR